MQLNGWQRLWLCLFLLWTVPVAIGSYVWWESWLDAYQRSATEARAREGKTLAQYLRHKYGREYDDMSDYELEVRTEVKGTHEYSDLPRTSPLTVVDIPLVGAVHFPRDASREQIEADSARVHSTVEGGMNAISGRSGRWEWDDVEASRRKAGVREYITRNKKSRTEVRFFWIGKNEPTDDDIAEIDFRRSEWFVKNWDARYISKDSNYGDPARPLPSWRAPATITLGIWMLPSVMLYVSGAAVAWIRRGFREKESGS